MYCVARPTCALTERISAKRLATWSAGSFACQVSRQLKVLAQARTLEL